MSPANDNGPLGRLDLIKSLVDESGFDFSYIVCRPDYCNPSAVGASVYVMQCGDFVKVGHALDVHKRLATIQTANPLPVLLLHSEELETRSMATRCEKAVHKALEADRLHSEWFSTCPARAIHLVTQGSHIVRLVGLAA